MKFELLDEKMRKFETAHDHCVSPNMYIVVRLDGRSFTRQTKEVWDLERPFDVRFRDAMIEATAHIMTCGFNVVYGYAQSDEISLLLAKDECTFGRKTRKLISILAGEASAAFTLHMQKIACFDARICELPTAELVKDYFAWRQADAQRNALNAHCYWLLRKHGQSVQQATDLLIGRSMADKDDFLSKNDISFSDLPLWQKRGVALYWESYQKKSVDPRTQETVFATRKRIKADIDLMIGFDYQNFILNFT